MAKKVIIPEDAQGDQSGPEALNNMLAIVEPITEKPSFIDLIKFDKKEQSIKIIKDKSAEYAKVTIDGVEDTANYKLVTANMGQMRDDRRTFEKAAYDKVIDPLKKTLKDYADDIEAVVVEFKAAEQAERDKKDFIDGEKTRIKKEKEEAKIKATAARINDLFVLGAILANNCYTFAYDSSLMINSLQIAEFSDDEFSEFLEEVKTAWTVEQDRLEADRLEGVRLQAEQDELAETNRKQAEQNKAQEQALGTKLIALRLKELRLMGAIFDDQTGDALLPDMHNQVVPRDVIETMAEELWDELLVTIQEYEPEVVEPEPEPHPYAGQNTEYFSGPPAVNGASIAEELDIEVAQSEEVESETVTTQYVVYMLRFGDFGIEGQYPVFKDIPISEKFKVRLFPEAFEDEAVNGCTIHNEGTLETNGLRWAVIKVD